MDFMVSTFRISTLLVVARFAGMMVFAPVFGEGVVHVGMRVMIAIVLALGVAGQLASPAAMPTSAAGLGLAVAGELLIGIAIGYAARLIFVGVELGAFHASQQMGISLGEIFNPMGDETPDTVRRFFHLLVLVIFLAVGGHRVMIGSLIKSFHAVPLMTLLSPSAILVTVVGLLGAAFTLALKLAAPVLLAMLLASVAMGFVQRTMPQLNILSTGLPIRAMLGLLVIGAVLALGVLPDLVSAAASMLGRQLDGLWSAGR